MVVNLLSVANVTVASFVQPLNALPPMVVTLLGMVMPVKALHIENAESPMVVTLLGMVTLAKAEQPRNT